MDNSTEAYLMFVVLGVVLVAGVGQLLVHAGKVYLAEVFPDSRVADSVSRLLTVLFYLFALGLLGIISTMDVPVRGAAQTVVTKLGVIMLVLGVVFGATMMVLSRIRARRQEQEQEESMMAASMPGGAFAPQYDEHEPHHENHDIDEPRHERRHEAHPDEPARGTVTSDPLDAGRHTTPPAR
jgi:hypothetical protein